MKASKKNAARLKKRILLWEDIKTTTMYGERTKLVNGEAFHKPGSQKK